MRAERKNAAVKSAALLLLLCLLPRVRGVTQYVHALGPVTSWYSDDTRWGAATTDEFGNITTGQTLHGLVASWHPYFTGGPAATAADDVRIGRQIYFSNPYAGSDGDNGVMSLSGTTGPFNSNSGKSSVRFYTGGVIAPGSALATITARYHWCV
jgi:hypothetical protein